MWSMLAERGTATDEFPPPRVLMLVLLAMIILVGASRLSVEAPFFGSASLVTSAGLAPVPQIDPYNPAVDQALQRAAIAVPPGAVCVIARDSWDRDYLRASYLLMPRRVWPAARLLANRSPSIGTIAAALSNRKADCLLVQPGTPVPGGWRRVIDGAYAAYVPARRS